MASECTSVLESRVDCASQIIRNFVGLFVPKKIDGSKNQNLKNFSRDKVKKIIIKKN